MKPTALLSLLLAGCLGANDSPAPLVDDFDAGKADAAAGPRSINCHTTDAAAHAVHVTLTPHGETFDIDAEAQFTFTGVRPSLNVAVNDDDADAPAEFVDFRVAGLTTIPALGTPRLELSLATGTKTMTYVTSTTQLELRCKVSAPKLLAYLDIAPVGVVQLGSIHAVGFDIDDTLLFSSPAFARGLATGGTPASSDATFWTQVNGCDAGCAAETITLPDGTTKELPENVPSRVKHQASLVEYHFALGHEVYAITARPDISGGPLRDYLEEQLGLPRDHVFFEPGGKAGRMHSLGLDAYYGDSDSDITEAANAHVRGIRFLRSPRSSNRQSGRLAKYHPGYFGEPIIANSYE